MELLSPLQLTNGRSGSLRESTDKLRLGAGRLLEWLADKSRQFRSLTADETLAKALFSDEKAPAEGTRLTIGETINVYHPDGSRTRLRICGVRSGGFSNAYSVIDLDEMRAYCLKENRALPGDERVKNRSLAVEAEISLCLGRHPHFVSTRAAFYYRSRLYLLTEYLPDESLDVGLQRGRFSVAEAVNYAMQICRAMEYGRTRLRGFIHGDIKPGNCLLTPHGQLKLGDFGMSSATGIGRHGEFVAADTIDTTDRSLSRGWGGTAPYMAPEMFDRGSPDRTNADIYALGAMLFEMVAGVRPFRHPSKTGLIRMHRTAKPPLEILDSPSVPEALVELIRGCLAKSPADRPQSFREVEAKLLRIASDNLDAPAPLPVEREEGIVDTIRVAMSFAAIGKLAAATAAIENGISAWGGTAELLAAKSLVLLLTGDVEAAYEASTAALMRDAHLFAVLLAHARVLIARKNFDNAREYLERARRMEPDNCLVLNLLGGVCYRNGEFDESKKYLRRALTVDPAQPQALNSLAQIEMALGRDLEAAKLAHRSLIIDSGDPASHLIFADANVRLGKMVEAVKAYKNVLRLDPDSKDVRHKYVRSCTSMFPDARRGFARFLILGAKFLQARQPSPVQASQFAERVMKEMDSSPEIAFFVDLTLAKLADGLGSRTLEKLSSKLKSEYGAAAAAESLPYHLSYSFGRVFYHLDEIDACEMVFVNMLDRFGPNESSYYYLAACAEIREDYSKALELYKKASQLLDCEDSRTGIRRVSHQLNKRPKAAS